MISSARHREVMEPSKLRGDPASVLGAVLEGTEDDATVTCPRYEILVALTEALATDSRSSTVRVITSRSTARAASREFVLATRLADLLAADAVALRVVEDDGIADALVGTPERVVGLVTTLPGDAFGLSTTDADVVADAGDALSDLWADARDFDVDAPAYSTVSESIAEEFGDDLRVDFDRAMSALASGGDGPDLDVVDVLIVLGAKHGVQLYDLSRWVEDAGIASRAKTSNAKRRLEDLGVVDADTIPTDSVGRPRQRLSLSDESTDASVEEFVESLRRTAAE